MGIHCKILFNFAAYFEIFYYVEQKFSELHLKWNLSAQIPKKKKLPLINEF